MENQKYVYHASNKKGLTRLEPRESAHKQKWIYATKVIAISALFLGDNFDFINQIGTSKGITYVYERFEGALEHAYKDKSGVIYKLPAKTFMEGKTQWSAEVVSTIGVNILEEVDVTDTLSYLFDLEKKQKIAIYRYPNVPDDCTNSKENIIQKAVSYTIERGEKYLDLTEKYHTDILPTVIEKLKKANYLPKSKEWINRFGYN